jgi:hypothetical protein
MEEETEILRLIHEYNYAESKEAKLFAKNQINQLMITSPKEQGNPQVEIANKLYDFGDKSYESPIQLSDFIRYNGLFSSEFD